MTTMTKQGNPRLHEGLDLRVATEREHYVVLGVDDPSTWAHGYDVLLRDAEIGEPSCYFLTTGAEINHFAGVMYGSHRMLPPGLTVMMFPIEGLDVSRLATFRLRQGLRDKWFSDLIASMQGRA